MMQNEAIKILFDKKPTVVSAHMSGAGKFGFLLVSTLPSEYDKNSFKSLVVLFKIQIMKMKKFVLEPESPFTRSIACDSDYFFHF